MTQQPERKPLLIPAAKFAALDLKDHAAEDRFFAALQEMGIIR